MSEIVDCISFIVRKSCWSLAVFVQFIFLRFLDLLGLIFNLLACLTIVRLPFMIAHFKAMKDMGEWRFIGLLQIVIFLTDVPIFIMGCIVIFTLWRVYPCFNELKEKWSGRYLYHGIYYTGFKIRGVIIKHFFTLFIDAVCLPTGIVCLISWRSVIFINKIRTASDDWKRRKICFAEFLQVLLDIPLILCLIISMLSWRLPFLIYQINKDKSENKSWTNRIRYRGIENVCYIFLDIPCVIMFVVCACTWRLPLLFSRVKQSTSLWLPKTQTKIRQEICIEFLLLFCDIPCIIFLFIILSTLWRIPTLISRIKKVLHDRESLFTRLHETRIRKKCLQEFGMLFVDFFCFILFILIVASLWRLYPLIQEIRKYFKRYKEHKLFEQQHVDHSSNVAVELTNETANEPSTEDSPEDVISNNIETVKPLSWSKCTWKIRKSICINFLMLFIDIPAIVLFLFLIITILRAPKVISAILGSGNFYMLFAVSVYHQTLRFFIDLAFLLLFLVLSITRPIQVWVHLLEDDAHKTYRILRDEIIPWGPDIAYDRKDLYRQMNDTLSIAIKENTPYNMVRTSLENIFQKHLQRINNLINKINDKEIEDEYVNILVYVRFYENNRICKLMRKHFVEAVYLQRPDVRIHEANTLKLKEEMRNYENKLNVYYAQLISYELNSVPLYEDTSGLSLRTRKETRQVLIECLPRGRFVLFFMMLIATLPLYRAPTMFSRLYYRWYNRFSIVTETLKEYALDLLAVLQILFVLIVLYRAPFLIVDIADCLTERRSWRAVRNVVKKYPPSILDDVVSLITNIFSWNTPRLLVTTLLFIILIPADLFLSVARIWYENSCIAYSITVLLYTFFVGSPFVIVYYLSTYFLEARMGWLNMVAISLFYILLLTLLTILLFSVVRDRQRNYLLEVPACDYIRYSWYNIHLLFFELLEFLQGLALVFKLANIPMYGGATLHAISSYLLFSFLPFKVIFWTTVTCFSIWFLVCGAPIILENILETLPIGTCSKRSSWRLAVSVFANTLFITLMESFMSFTSCYYNDFPKNTVNMTLGNATFNAEVVLSTLVEDTSIRCWQEKHIPYALFGLLGALWYSTTAIIYTTKYGDPDTVEQDIGFSPVYNTLVNILKAVMIISVTIVTNYKYISIGVLIALNAFAVGFTLGFRTMFKYQPCNVLSVLVWRMFSFLSSIVALIAVVIAFQINDNESKIPVLVLGVGILLLLVASIVIALKLDKESEIIKDRAKFRRAILMLEEKVLKNKWLLETWKSQSGTWKRLSKTVVQARKDDRTFNVENWNLDNIFSTSQQSDTSNTQPPPLSCDSTVAYEAPPLPNPTSMDNHPPDESTTTTAASQPLTSAINSVGYNPTPLPDTGFPLPITEINSSQSSDNNASSIEVDEMSSLFREEVSYVNPCSPSDIEPPIGIVVNREEVKSAISDLPYNILKLEKNGRNLLLMFEKHIHYFAYRYSFLSQRNHWLNAVWESNWTGLLHCLEILASNLKGDYNRPSHLDVTLSPKALPTDSLKDDIHDTKQLPRKIKKLTQQEKIDISEQLRTEALNDIKSIPEHGNEWGKIFDVILPKVPGIISSWNYEPNITSLSVYSILFEVKFNRSTTGTIVEIESTGNKFAKGASFSIGKSLRGTFSTFGLKLEDGKNITGKKGPISVTVDNIGFLTKNNQLYLEAKGKKVKYDVAMASTKTIKWK